MKKDTTDQGFHPARRNYYNKCVHTTCQGTQLYKTNMIGFNAEIYPSTIIEWNLNTSTNFSEQIDKTETQQ